MGTRPFSCVVVLVDVIKLYVLENKFLLNWVGFSRHLSTTVDTNMQVTPTFKIAKSFLLTDYKLPLNFCFSWRHFEIFVWKGRLLWIWMRNIEEKQRMNHERSQDFSKGWGGGGSHWGIQRVLARLSPEYCRLFAYKKAYNWREGVTCTLGTPLLRPWVEWLTKLSIVNLPNL